MVRIAAGSMMALAMAALLAGCGGTSQDAASNVSVPDVATPPVLAPEAGAPSDSSSGRAPADGTARPLVTDGWVGKWIGPEGLFVEIAQGGERGRYALVIKGDLDSNGDRVSGMAEGDTIRFVRGTTVETLRASDGDGTGLKWLAGKKDCLVVKPGEGYCRD